MVLKRAAIGALKITNPAPLDKKTQISQRWLTSRFFCCCALVSGLLLSSEWALALPATIAWELPLIHAETYQLDVATTPGFATSVLKSEVKGTGYTGELPGEGVYHWRLSRPGTASDAPGGEKSTLASGSFVLLDPEVKRLTPPRITWDAVAGAQRYKVYLLGADSQQRVVTVSGNSFLLPKVDEPLMVEIVPFTDGQRSSREFHLDPSLTLLAGAPQAAPAPPLMAAAVPATPPPPAEEPQIPRRRFSLVYLFGMGVEETLRVQKLELDLKSTARGGGGGGGFWLNPAYGLILSGQADYHEHDDPEVKQESLFPGRKLTISESRFSADLMIGYNLLDFFGSRRFVFEVAGAAAVTQLPLVPPELAVAPPLVPGLNKERLSLIGGGLALGYLGQYVSLIAEAAGLTESKAKGRLNYERLLLDIYPSSLLSIELGVFNRNAQASRCAEAAAVCLTVGSSLVEAHETGVFLGLGAVLL